MYPKEMCKMYDFNVINDRRNTNSLKFDFAKENNMPELAYQSTYSALCAKGMEEGSDYILRVAGTGMPKMMVF